MHELSLCRSIEAIVVRAAAGRPVQEVELDVGVLRQVVPQTLEYCWGVVTEDGPLAGSQLRINRISGVISCDECQDRTELTGAFPMMLCGTCGSPRVTVLTGEEFLVRSVELAKD